MRALATFAANAGVPPILAPELAARGIHSAGVPTSTITNPDQPGILQFDNATGKATIELSYPATIPAGKALRDAPSKTGQRYPLVIVSHSHPGSRAFLTWLTEDSASKGYNAAAIDHTASVSGPPAALAGDETRRPYRTVSVPRSNDAKDVANDDATLWKRLPKHWAPGPQLHSANPQ